ncbi:DnaJ domain containing protein [Parasponia andersonii]|uniref:DnaJ domain containing protein n=1 Tax=Parasponia andersonii TaxID=3476 RepID=A0A2P5E413_PARAD|nr:DnaJ domain containing protein [Parasponia andersonii]
MDCNKEEALRARDIAEKKMQSKEFMAARKIALKAQQLYPDVENISQMLMVCDVHCSAAQKLAGNEMDWYGILQVEERADEATIKKQYRKFALQLHPDKNKFSGAEAAFKLIGEAQRILLDTQKRHMHNMRRKSSMSGPPTTSYPSHKTNSTSNVVPNNNRSNPSGLNSQNQQSRQSTFQGNQDPRSTFWTVCPFCSVRYQYYKEVVNRSLRCQSCQKPFVAYDINAPATGDFSKPVFSQQKNNTHKVEAQYFGAGNSKAESVQTPGKKVDHTSGIGTVKVNHKREKKHVRDQSEISESEPSLSESSSNSDEDISIDENGNLLREQNTGNSGEQNPRRSSRHKHQVSYKENISEDDDYVRPSKRAKGKTSSCFAEGENGDPSKGESDRKKNLSDASIIKEDEKGVERKEGGEECLLNVVKAKKNEEVKEPVDGNGFKKRFEGCDNMDSSSEEASDLQFFKYPDPEFNDFDKEREEDRFAAGQIWAAYDVQNAMPRVYARIKKVYSPGFKVQIIWLEPDPNGGTEIKWYTRNLPFSCGKFKYGSTEKTDNRLMFSHLVAWEKGRSRDTFMIHPRRGETWALFKNWDIKWSCDPVAHSQREYEYEFVEILTNYDSDVGIHVAILSKVKGFVSIFCRMEKVGKKTFLVPPGELLRFSHMIPSYRMKGNERGVPLGSLELDTAALPIEPTMESDSDTKRSHLEPQQNSSTIPSTSTPEDLEIPDPEFYNFDDDKSKEKFQVGQIWALYSDEDGLPKYYGHIKKIDHSPSFKLHISWLISSSLPVNVVRWSDDDMPISFGRFKLEMGEGQAYDSIVSFSHQVRAEPTGRRQYEIFPRKGEVWAVYRNWSPEIQCSDLANCEYDIVEVLSATALLISVLVLDRVDGFSSVFKARMEGETTITWSIPQIDFLKFSHQIPAFRLTKERDGRLRGFWELDTAALPVHYFCSS